MKDLILRLRKLLIDSVQKSPAEGLLLSGGLDSAILAAINPCMKAITVNLELFGEDIRYSNMVVKFLNMEHFHRSVGIDEAIEAIPEVTKTLKSFDPAIPNDLVVYFGFKLAKELGIRHAATGDGSDELFGGYSFMKEMRNLNSYIKRLSQKMEFNSNELGRFFNVAINQPYLNSEIMELALDIPREFKIRQENGSDWGKWILRKAFEGILPKEVIWQDKRPLEYGSGMTKLRDIISAKIRNEEFDNNPYSIKFINKEHFYYYKVYRDAVGEIPKPAQGEEGCPGCGAGIKPGSFHCKVCGYVLEWRL